MSVTRTRAVAVAAAVAGIGLVAAAGYSVLRRQAAIARRRIGKPLGEDALDADRVWRASAPGEPLELLLLGDSIAAGLGAERRKDTLGGRLSKGLAKRMHRPVRLRTVAVVGAESSDLQRQVGALPDGYRAHVAVLVVGGNDVTHRVAVPTSITHLRGAIAHLHTLGIPVVVGTCPDLGALRPVPQPLRALGSRLSRQLADAQAAAAIAAGAEAVSLRRAVGPFFISNPDEMFGLDRFHPSALGYRRTADALLPAVVRAASSSAVAAPRRPHAP